MRTSATGNSPRVQAANRRAASDSAQIRAQAASRRAASVSAQIRAQAASDRVASDSAHKQGFTLVELMATLAIVGLAAGAVMLTLPETEPRLGDEAARLAARLTAAREEAVMTNRVVAIEADAAGYGARVFDGRGWTPLIDGPFQAETWQADTRMQGEAVRVAFDPTGVAEPATIALSRDDAQVAVSVDGAGEVRIASPKT